jgi:hypothetical protein
MRHAAAAFGDAALHANKPSEIKGFSSVFS